MGLFLKIEARSSAKVKKDSPKCSVDLDDSALKKVPQRRTLPTA